MFLPTSKRFEVEGEVLQSASRGAGVVWSSHRKVNSRVLATLESITALGFPSCRQCLPSPLLETVKTAHPGTR